MTILNQSFLKNGNSSRFTILLENEFINTHSGEIYITSLETKYRRVFYDIPLTNLGFVKYIVDETNYKKRESEEFKKWTFAQGFEFYNAIYALKDKEQKKMLLEESRDVKAFETVEESFYKLPKLPSVFLLMMQVFDILAMDSFLSFIHSEEDLLSFPNQYRKIEEISNQSIDMSIGGGIGKSEFMNSNFYIGYLGNSYTYEIFDYYADPSQISVGSLNTTLRKNKSLYSGKVLVSKEDGDIYHGYMHEIIIPTDGSHKVISRKINLHKGG